MQSRELSPPFRVTPAFALTDSLPGHLPVVAFLRHAARDALPPGRPGTEVPLNDAGRAAAHHLGSQLGPRVRSLRSSPVGRCVETATLIGQGARLDLTCPLDELLGEPGAFITHGRLAWESFRTLPLPAVVEALMQPPPVLPGFRPPGEAVPMLVQHLLLQTRGLAGLHIAVTHDYMVTLLALQLLDLAPADDLLADFLEPVIFWQEPNSPHTEPSSPGTLHPSPPELSLVVRFRHLQKTVPLRLQTA